MNYEDKNVTKLIYGDNIGRVQLIEAWGSDKTIVNSARVSFGVHKKEIDSRDEKLIKYLIKHKHTSTLEHCGLTCKFVVPLYVRSQHHRHRTWSYNEISRRYTDVNIQFYEPQKFRSQHKSNRQASNAEQLFNPEVGDYLYDDKYIFRCLPCEDEDMNELVSAYHNMSLNMYNMMIEKGVCREQARGVLPQNMYTEYYGTVNLNNLIKFIMLRTHEGAQWEIQQVANALIKISEDLWPITMQAMRDTELIP